MGPAWVARTENQVPTSRPGILTKVVLGLIGMEDEAVTLLRMTLIASTSLAYSCPVSAGHTLLLVRIANKHGSPGVRDQMAKVMHSDCTTLRK